MLKYLCIIQARLGSKRFPNKVMELVDGVPMVKRVWNAAKAAEKFYGSDYFKVKVAWPERYPDLDESDVLGRFQRMSNEYPSECIVRLTADCPLLTFANIYMAVLKYNGEPYYNNYKDGHDVQIFTRDYLFTPNKTHREHVLIDNYATGGDSVNTREDLERVRKGVLSAK